MTHLYKTRYQVNLRVKTSGTTKILLETRNEITSSAGSTNADGWVDGIAELLAWICRIRVIVQCHTPTGYKTETVIVDPSDVYRTIEENEGVLTIDSGDDPETECDYELELRVVPIGILTEDAAAWNNCKLFLRSKDVQDGFLAFDGQTAEEVFDNLAKYLGRRGAMTIAHALERTGRNGPTTLRNLSITCSNLDLSEYAEAGEHYVVNPEITGYQIQVNYAVNPNIMKSVTYHAEMSDGQPAPLPNAIDWTEYGYDSELAEFAIFEYHLRGLDRFRGNDPSMLWVTNGGKTTISINRAFYKAQ